MSEIKLVAFDVDGTFVDSKREVLPSTIEALRELKRRGIEVVINSGRPYTGIKQIADQAGKGLIRYYLAFNGAILYDSFEDKVLFKEEIDKDKIKALTTYIEKYKVDMHVYTEKSIVLRRKPYYNYYAGEADFVGLDVEYRDYLEMEDEFSKLMVTADPEKLDEVRHHLPEDLYDQFSVTKTDPVYLEFMKKGVTKGSGLKHLAKLFNLSSDEVMAFGDEENDIAMIEFAKYGIAMENAIPELKAKADFVTKSNDEDGVAYALDKLLFHQDK